MGNLKGILRTHCFSQTLSQNHLILRPISAFSQNCSCAIAQEQQKLTQADR
ncbi:hypothetical protein [Nostoc sp. C117]|uniref:hypothetical protein n=1 Tax=Nostoc sp. C117 TaxID=3349875 RepID=UPI00370D02B9